MKSMEVKIIGVIAGLILGAIETYSFSITPRHPLSTSALHTINQYKQTATNLRAESDNSNEISSSIENKDTSSDAITSLLSSLPSPEVVKENVLEGEFGQRGEKFVFAQFSLLFLIAIGPSIPIFDNFCTSFLGISFIISGLVIVYKSATDLKNNLSPWPTPPDPKSGRGSLISDGIYAYIRHPMYSGLLCGMVGLSLITDSALRMMLTVILYFVLDAKSDYEEVKLVETYGEEYESYRMRVKGKFVPGDLKDILTF